MARGDERKKIILENAEAAYYRNCALSSQFHIASGEMILRAVHSKKDWGKL